MKFYKMIGVATCVLLVVSCFLPWTFHADVQKDFTGFFSEKDTYGKPGKVFVFLGLCALALVLIQKIWAKRALIFIAALLVAYLIKTYILYTSCYNAYCPDKRYGLFFLVLSVLSILLVSFFPDMPIGGSVTAPSKPKDIFGEQ